MSVAWAFVLAMAGAAGPAQRTAFVDELGVLRWREDRAEVALFGVNYYAPFSLDYEGLAAAGEDHRRAIEHDTAHFARLGLDAIRLHVFDRQISDPQGNLLANRHLDLFDYLVAQAKQRGIYTVLTPIAWWPCNPGGHGFSSRFTMPQMITGAEARRAQTTYLRQFLDHVNSYTGRAYKDEPAIVAIELINEPLYSPGTTPAQITQYIHALADAVRATGARQPIFYNGWQGQEQAVADARIEGCTFGWYPTGLVSGCSLRGNYLPLLDDYPGMRLPCLARKAKIVYEFDAADAVTRCLYPAMARAFRSGGAQIATQFQYDPVALAQCNYGWQTHYLNLAYAPGKAVSFAIAAEAFRRTPRLARYGRYPQNTAFGPFRLSYERDVSVLAADTAYYYCNDTDVQPPAPGSLTRIAGCGSSPVVRYEGTGAYFLDRVAEGVWRLEVYPDAVWVDDPHAPTRLDREVSRLIWARRLLTVRLPELGSRFSARRVAPQSGEATVAVDGGVAVEPGVYVLAREPKALDAPVSREFYAPPPRPRGAAVWWEGPARWRAGNALPLRVTVAAEEIREVILHWQDAARSDHRVPMVRTAPYVYSTELPAARLSPGSAMARLEIRAGQGIQWAPPGAKASSAVSDPAVLFAVGAKTPVPVVSRESTGGFRCAAELAEGNRLRVQSEGFGRPPCAAGFRLPVQTPGGEFDTLVVRARATAAATDKIEVGLVQRDGRAYGYDMPLWPDWSDVRIPLRQLRPLWGTPAGRLDPRSLNELSLIFGAWLYGDRREQPHGFELQRAWLEQEPQGWRIVVEPPDAPVELFSAGDLPVRVHGQEQRETAMVRGKTFGRSAVRISTPSFEPAPSAIHFRQAVPDQLRFFGHWPHPEGRGAAGDRVHADAIEAVNVCFGAWLYGPQASLPHGIELQSIALPVEPVAGWKPWP